MTVSHTTTSKIEYYVVRFDCKEFKVKVIDAQRHHKDYPEITQVEIVQIPSSEDNQKVRELLNKEGHL